MSDGTYLLTVSIKFKADFDYTNISKIEIVFRHSLFLRFESEEFACKNWGTNKIRVVDEVLWHDYCAD